MKRTLQYLPYIVSTLLLGVALLATSAVAQVVETEPSPVQTDQPFTIFFNAAQGNGDLAGFDGDIYAYTGLITEESSSQTDWQYVKPAQFGALREDSRLEQVGPDRYKLEVENIRAFYSDNDTGAGFILPDEEIEQIAILFYGPGGSPVGRDVGGGDIFIGVEDVGDDRPLALGRFIEPQIDPLNPFITSTDTTLTVEAEAIAFNTSITSLRLLEDGQEVAAAEEGETVVEVNIDLFDPGRTGLTLQIESEDTEPFEETISLVRTPEVQDEPRPANREDGIEVSEGGSSVFLSLYAPGKDFVYVIGDFNDWQVDNDFFMKRESTAAFGDEDGAHWWIEIDGLDPDREYAFQYFVDGEVRTGDPFSHKVLALGDLGINQPDEVYPGLKEYPVGLTENKVSVFNTSQQEFDWVPFERPPQEELVIYELLIRDFNEEKTYASLIDELDYLEGLGINAIELMPVSNFDGNISWGYNPNFHLATEKSYGPAEDLKEFINEAHDRGIAVLLDVVYNHVTERAPFVLLYGANADNPFLNIPASTPFSVFQQVDHDHPYIQYWLDRANRHWLEEYNIDGYRFDLTKGFIGGQPSNPDGTQPRRIENLQRMADEIWAVDEDAIVILEHFGTDDEEAQLANHRVDETGGMLLWNGQNFNYRQAAAGNLGGGSTLTSTYSPRRNGDFERLNHITYMESHDEQWLMRDMKAFGQSEGAYDIQSFETALDRSKLAGAFFLTVPGPRMLWQYGEVGYGWGQDECVNSGGGDVFEECQLDGSTLGRTDPKPVRLEYRDEVASPERTRLRQTWSALLRLRAENEVFHSPDTNVSLRLTGSRTMRDIRLTHETQDAVIVGNFGLTARQASVTFTQTGTWYDFFSDTSREVSDTAQSLWLQPGEFRVFTTEPQTPPEPGLVIAPDETLGPPEELSFDLSRTFGDVGQQSSYQLIGLPGQVDLDLAATLEGDPGEQWRAFRDNGQQSDFFEEYTPEAPLTFAPGRGFWVISEDPWTAAEENVSAPAFDDEGATTIEVHDGWNIISNPMDTDIDWALVQGANGISQTLWAWTGTGYEPADTFESAAASGAAYYYRHDFTTTQLSLPYPGSLAAQSAASAALTAPLQALRTTPTLRLTARAEEHGEASVRTGLSEREVIYDAAPRASFASLALSIDATEEQPAAVTRLVPDAFDGHTFDLSLKGPRGEDVVLTAEGLDAFGSAEVRLFDPMAERMYDLRTEEAIRLQPDGRTMPLQLLVGSRDYVEQPTAPDALALKRNYPNPFAETTTIEYAVPEDMPIRIEVFDVLGRQVATLTDEPHRAGTHDVRWDGRDGSGGRVASGVYLVRLTAGAETKVKRITLVR